MAHANHRKPFFFGCGSEWRKWYDKTPKWLLAEMCWHYAMAAHGEEAEWTADKALQLRALQKESVLCRHD